MARIACEGALAQARHDEGGDPGQEAVLDRLLDLLVVAVLRTWFARAEARAPGWYHAQADPIAGRALRLLHNNPEHPWTVATLADEIGISRAAFAKRLTEMVGEPPMAYLTGWSLTLAADLLTEPNATVGSVARKVGYHSPFTFSTAFKRHHGRSPQAHRSRQLTDQQADSGQPLSTSEPVRIRRPPILAGVDQIDRAPTHLVRAPEPTDFSASVGAGPAL